MVDRPTEGEIDMMAITLHEAFQSFKRAGFTDEQALELTKTILESSTNGAGR